MHSDNVKVVVDQKEITDRILLTAEAVKYIDAAALFCRTEWCLLNFVSQQISSA